MSESNSVGDLTRKMYFYMEAIDRKHNSNIMGRI